MARRPAEATSAALAAGAADGRAGAAGQERINWAGTHRWRPAAFCEASSVEEVVAAVRTAASRGQRLRVVGTGHSPNDMAATPGVQLSVRGMRRVLEVSREARTVSVEAGATLAELNEVLAECGLALSSLGSISEQQIGGALATAFHGTGTGYTSLSAALEWLELVDGTGRLWRCSRQQHPEVFYAAAVSLGCLGVVTSVCLRCEPAFRLREVSEPSTLDAVLSQVDRVARSAEHCRFWWVPHSDRVVVTRQDRTEDPPTPEPGSGGALDRARHWLWGRLVGYHALEASLAAARAFPALVPAVNRAFGAILFGRRTERVGRSDRVFNFDCLFRQNVDEWCIPADRCAEAMRRLRETIEGHGLRAHFPVEVRFSAAEDVWLSPAYGRESCYIGVIMYRPFGMEADFERFFLAYEDVMRGLGGRPHWAKFFRLRPGEPRSMYPKWDDFLAVRSRLDPRGVFANEFTDRVFGVRAAPSAAKPRL